MKTKLQEWTIWRESVEWVGPVTVNVDGVAAGDFDVTLAKRDVRPIGPWTAPISATFTDADGAEQTGFGVVVGPGTDFPLAIGSYFVLVRVTTQLQSPVVEVGVVNIV